MPKQTGRDGRHRDDDGNVHRKNGTTQIETLRNAYGENSARGLPKRYEAGESARSRASGFTERLSQENGCQSDGEHVRHSTGAIVDVNHRDSGTRHQAGGF